MITFDVWQHELTDMGELAFAFPLHEGVGTASTAAVLFELVPGGYARHPHRQRRGDAAGAAGRGRGDGRRRERGSSARGRSRSSPRRSRTAIRNTGEEPLRVLGIFTSSTVLSYFEEAPVPGAPTVFVNGTPAGIPVAA